MEKFYITIGREKGAGGIEIATKLSKKLGISFYDKQLLDIAASNSGLCKDIFENIDEKPKSNFFSYFLANNYASIYTEMGSTSIIDRQELFRIQSEAIRMISNKESAIFVGRCADYILRDSETCLNVFISSSMEDRIKRLKEANAPEFKEDMSQEQMSDLLQKIDEKRAKYYNYFSYKTWGSAQSYDICLNSSFLGVDKCVDVIVDVLKTKGWIE